MASVVVLAIGTQALAHIGPRDEIIALPLNDPRVRPAFAALGNIYEIVSPQGSFILSGKAPYNMNQRDAVVYCQMLGAQLPSLEQLVILSSAMGTGTSAGYNAKLIPDMANNACFLSSSELSHYPYSIFCLMGDFGYIISTSPLSEGSIRCVIEDVKAPSLSSCTSFLSESGGGA